MQKQSKYQRGDVYKINFDPQVGDEIKEPRPAVIMSKMSNYPRKLRIVVPLTTGSRNFSGLFWMIEIPRTTQNGLRYPSRADASQVKSLSTDRFIEKISRLTNAQMDEIAAAVALCIGYQPALKA